MSTAGRPSISRPAPREAASLGVLLFGLLLSAPAVAGPKDPQVSPSTPFEDAPAAWTSDDGFRHLLYRPRFVEPKDLLADALRFGLPPTDVVLDPLRSRLLVSGPDEAFRDAMEALAFLDAPTPSVLVEVSIIEAATHGLGESGGHGAYDRNLPPGSPDTFFRGIRFDFEPESWLRSQLVGARPFEGTSADFHQATTKGSLAGTLDLVLRRMVQAGEADFLARPSLVCTEGIPAKVESTLSLPVSVFTRNDAAITVGSTVEKAGVSLEILAESIGADAVRLRLHPWLRQLSEQDAETGPRGYPVLSIRELTTTLTISDGETVIVGGLGGFRRLNERNGPPGLSRLPALDTWVSAKRNESQTQDVLFLVRARILSPGRPAATVVPPAEPERLKTCARKACCATPR